MAFLDPRLKPVFYSYPKLRFWQNSSFGKRWARDETTAKDAAIWQRIITILRIAINGEFVIGGLMISI
jgi:hypothetical protein